MRAQERHNLRKSNYEAFENFLVAKYERLAGVSRPRSYPYIMTIDPTNVCQLRCPACYTGMANERLKSKGAQNKSRPSARASARLSGSVLDSVLEECGDLVFYCHFYNWGEPLLNENLADLIRSAHDREIYTKVDTNLSLKCTDEKLEGLLLCGLDELSVSIDGFSQATYEQYRVGGRFDLVLENLERLVEMKGRLGGPTKIKWKFLVYSFNEHEVEDAAAFCRDRQIDFVAGDAIILHKNSEWMPTYRREGKPNPYRIAPEKSHFVTPSGQIPLYPGRPDGRTCGWHYSYTTINADGGVLPCCGLYDKQHDFGHVTAEPGSFGKIWSGANFETVRRDFPRGVETNPATPTTACTRCDRAASFRDHYSVLDRRIIFQYWSFEKDSPVRQLDEFFDLLRRSPSDFAAAYAARYNAHAPALEHLQEETSPA